MASLDLSSAFDVVDVKLLIKRLYIIGLPGDVLSMVENWLTGRFFYIGYHWTMIDWCIVPRDL